MHGFCQTAVITCKSQCIGLGRMQRDTCILDKWVIDSPPHRVNEDWLTGVPCIRSGIGVTGPRQLPSLVYLVFDQAGVLL